MNKNKRFEILLSLLMLLLSATIALISVSLQVNPLATYFFGGLALVFAAIITINVYEE